MFALDRPCRVLESLPSNDARYRPSHVDVRDFDSGVGLGCQVFAALVGVEKVH